MTTILNPQYDDAALRETIARCGARFADDPHGPQAEVDAPAGAAFRGPSALPPAGRVALLADWGIVSATGADAVSFLQGQTTNDVAAQAGDEVRWNGYCTPKGRLLAAGPLWRDGEALRFAVSRPLAEPLRKRLSMFVLRAKAKLEDSSGTLAILGLTGEPAAEALRELGIEPPEPMRSSRAGGEAGPLAIGFPAASGIGPRWWLVVPADELADTWRRLAGRLAPASSSWWRASEILAGEPRIVPATSESFVPQTVNWELIGGVSFRKGCYPGQEVVARMHYRGKPKRRSFVARIAGGEAPAPGTDLLVEGAPEPAGLVVASAPAPDGAGIVVLFEAVIEDARRGTLRTPDGRGLQLLPLPYPLPLDAGEAGPGATAKPAAAAADEAPVGRP